MLLIASDNSIDIVENVDFITNTDLDIFNIGKNNIKKQNLGAENKPKKSMVSENK